MSVAGIKKAAMLLSTLDSGSAAELLKNVNPEMVTQIAAELAVIGQSALPAEKIHHAPMREFADMVGKDKKKGKVGNAFLQQVLDNAVGKGKSQEILGRIGEVLEARDPFKSVRAASVEDLAQTLAGESAQVAAIILMELPPKKSSQLLPALEDSVRAGALQSMTQGQMILQDTRLKVASVIRDRLDAIAKKRAASVAASGAPVEDTSGGPAAAAARKLQQYRKVAVLLRGLQLALRDNLLKSITAQDPQSADLIKKQMITWEDIPLVPDRALQQMLRGVDSRKLALALMKTEQTTITKVRANMSERASVMLDEETSLINNPKPDEIESAREAILDPLRELNSKGELTLEEK